MKYYINYNPVVDYATLAILLLFYAIFKSTFYSHEKKNIWMRLGLYSLFTGTLFNVLYMTLFKYNGPEILVYIFRDIANILLISCICIFSRYMAEMFERDNKIKKKIFILDIILLIIYSILTITSPFTHIGFYYINNEAVSGSFFLDPFTIFYIILVFILFTQLYRYRKSILIRPYIAIVFCFILVEGIMICEAISKSSTFVCFTYLLPILIVFSLFHSNSYDIKNGTLDAVAFNEYLKELNKAGKKYKIITFTFASQTNFNQLLEDLYKDLNHFYDKYFKNYTFRLSEHRFVLVYRPFENEQAEEEALEKFKNQVLELYKYHHLDFKSVLINSNLLINNANKFIHYINYIENTMEDNTYYKATDLDLNKYLNIVNITENLYDIDRKHNLNDSRVLVYIQPIYDVKSKRITCAESLMRLKINDEIIYPDVFIPIAEEHNYIHTLSLIMLNKVCKNLKELLDIGYDIDRISINFSTKELLLDNFCDEIKKIIKTNKVPFDKIGIEITESQTIGNFDLVLEKINKIKKLGVKLYLDDFGTGYSNFDRIMKLPIDIIKFDKSLVDNSMSDIKFKKMTQNFTTIYKELGYKILFEGVETKKEYDMCTKEMNAVYLQGYYYSRPVPIENIKNFINVK